MPSTMAKPAPSTVMFTKKAALLLDHEAWHLTNTNCHPNNKNGN
jgi:hypothetical protein